MKTSCSFPLVLTISLAISAAQLSATCGGGGGGGMGGMGSMSMGGGPSIPSGQVYIVPWRVRVPQLPPVTDGLVLYWFPSSVEEVQRSSLRNSRTLTIYAAQCISMEIADASSELGKKLVPGAKLPIAVLATPDGALISKAENKDGYLRVSQVEKLVDEEYKRREAKVDEELKDAKEHAKSGDNSGAIPIFKAVLNQKCLFPKKAKDAAKALKKLGVAEAAGLADAPDVAFPIFDRATGARVENALKEGLRAENTAHYKEAERLYALAHRIDPGDPTPLRYLGEVYRHHIGDWDRAREAFNAILAMPADPIARAVALHGLGKMTIHEGEFKKGLSLMEKSVNVFPIALAYRNLAVYWNSEVMPPRPTITFTRRSNLSRTMLITWSLLLGLWQLTAMPKKPLRSLVKMRVCCLRHTIWLQFTHNSARRIKHSRC